MKKLKNYTLKVYENDEVGMVVRTHSKRLILTRLRSINWTNKAIKTYFRVSYGKKNDTHGKLSTFYNDGDFYNKEDLDWAFEAFDYED